MIQAVNITSYIEMIPDPRTHMITHNFVDVVAIALLSKICGAEGWEDMQEFGRSRRKWLSTFLELPSGIPCPDTFRRIISCIDPSAFLEAFLEWIKAAQKVVPGLVSIDGKTIRSTVGGDNPIHIVSAWCKENQIILGQLRTESKSNEIAAIPDLLKQLTLPEGSIVTIDAAGTQRENATLIRKAQADYVLALKGNQPKLMDEVENFFRQAIETEIEYAPPLSQYTKEERGHGRMELRKVYATEDIDWLPQKADWRDLRSIVKLESIRWSEGVRTEEVRYYISSLPANAELLAKSIRGHWGVENQCHWVLDVVFKEDQTTITEGFSPENLRTMNLLVAKLLKNEKSCKKGIRAKQFKASLDHEYLHRVLSVVNL